MSTMPPLRNILNNTPASAVDVDWNFQTIEDYLATEVIRRDGSVAMQAPLNLLGAAPSLSTHAAPKSYVDAIIPVGMIAPYGGTAAPTGWVFCDGTTKSRTDPLYIALFAAIGTAFNTGGEVATEFRLPGLMARVPVGRLAADAQFGTLGARGGTRDTVLPSHNHTIGHGHNASAVSTNTNHTHDIDHGHGSIVTTLAGSHQHQATEGGFPVWVQTGAGTLGMDTSGTGHSGAPSNLLSPAVTSVSGDHVHQVNIPTILLTSGNVNSNASHTHTINVNDLAAGAVSSTVGVAPANTNYPLFQVVNYIIRIG